MLKKFRNFIDCSSTHIVDFVDLASSQRHSLDWIAHNVEKAHIALSSLHESTTLKEFTIKLLHDIQCWETLKLYWLIVDSHRWLRTLYVCNIHSWLSWESLLAHEKQRKTTTIVLNCFKELFIATSTQRHEFKHMQETKFNYSTRFQVFYLFNITKTYIVERVCTKALHNI